MNESFSIFITSIKFIAIAVVVVAAFAIIVACVASSNEIKK